MAPGGCVTRLGSQWRYRDITQPQNLQPVLHVRFNGVIVSQSLWEWETNDWFNLRPKPGEGAYTYSAWMARNLKIEVSETQCRIKPNITA